MWFGPFREQRFVRRRAFAVSAPFVWHAIAFKTNSCSRLVIRMEFRARVKRILTIIRIKYECIVSKPPQMSAFSCSDEKYDADNAQPPGALALAHLHTGPDGRAQQHQQHQHQQQHFPIVSSATPSVPCDSTTPTSCPSPSTPSKPPSSALEHHHQQQQHSNDNQPSTVVTDVTVRPQSHQRETVAPIWRRIVVVVVVVGVRLRSGRRIDCHPITRTRWPHQTRQTYAHLRVQCKRQQPRLDASHHQCGQRTDRQQSLALRPQRLLAGCGHRRSGHAAGRSWRSAVARTAFAAAESRVSVRPLCRFVCHQEVSPNGRACIIINA